MSRMELGIIWDVWGNCNQGFCRRGFSLLLYYLIEWRFWILLPKSHQLVSSFVLYIWNLDQGMPSCLFKVTGLRNFFHCSSIRFLCHYWVGIRVKLFPWRVQFKNTRHTVCIYRQLRKMVMLDNGNGTDTSSYSIERENQKAKFINNAIQG